QPVSRALAAMAGVVPVIRWRRMVGFYGRKGSVRHAIGAFPRQCSKRADSSDVAEDDDAAVLGVLDRVVHEQVARPLVIVDVAPDLVGDTVEQPALLKHVVGVLAP